MRRALQGVGAGARRFCSAMGQAIGMLEIATAAVGIGAYLLAREFFKVAPAAGIGLIVAGAVSLALHVLYDVAWLKSEGDRR